MVRQPEKQQHDIRAVIDPLDLSKLHNIKPQLVDPNLIINNSY